MATNRVEISPSNIPVWAPHEPVLHAFTHLRLRLKWGTGFPGSGGDIDLFGTVHLSKFRLVFVPDVPTHEFFSFVVPLSCISQIKSDVSSHSSSSASRLKTGFTNLFKGFSSSSAQDSSYELSEDHVNENARLKRLSFVLRPMVNERTDPMGLAMVLSGIPVIPTAPIVTTGVVTTMCEVSLTPKHVGDSGEEASRCLIHRGTLMSGHPSCPLTTLSTSLTSAVAAATASLAPGAASNAVLALAHVAAVQTPQDFGEYEFACAALGLPQATAPAPEDVFPPGDPVVPFPASTGTGAGSDRASNLIGGGLQRRTWQDDVAAEERARAQRQQMRDEHFRRQAERERANAGGEDIEPTGAAHVGMLGSVNANSTTAAVSSDEYTDAHAASADPAAPAAAAAQASALPPVPRSGSPAPPPYHATLPVLGPGVIANPYPDALRARPVQADLFGAGYDANATGNDRIEVGWTGEVRRVPSPVPLPAPEHLHGHGHAQGGSEPGNAAGGAGSDDEEEERAEEAREVAAAEVAAQGGKAPASHTIREDLHSAGQFVERVADAVVHGMNVDRGDANAPPPGYNDAMADKEKQKKTQSAMETEVEGETYDKNEEDEEEGVPSAVSM